VFILKNVTFKQYLNFTNGTERKKTANAIEELINHNNIYSIPEHILFSWVKTRVNKVNIH